MNTLRTISGISGLGFAQAPELAKKMTGYKSFVGEHFKTMMAGSVAGLRRIKTIMEDHLHDLEPIYKNWDQEVDNLINFPNRSLIISSLKTLNSGSPDGGLKFFDRMTAVMQLAGIDAMHGLTFVALREEILSMRQKARVLVTTRSAAVIVQKKRASDVDALAREAKALKVIAQCM